MSSSPATGSERCNVLVTFAGRKSYVIELLERSPRAGVIVAADGDPQATTVTTARHHAVVPECTDSRYIDALLALCVQHGCHCVLPQNDLDLQLLADHGARFAQAGVVVLGAPAASVASAADKWQMARWLAQHGMSAPPTWLPAEVPGAHTKLVVKARAGQGSAGFARIASAAELDPARTDLVVQPDLAGTEYNLDILRTGQGNVIAVVPKQKLAMRWGSTDKAVTVDAPELIALGVKLGALVAHTGTIDVDLLVCTEGAYVLDINPRVGGGFPYTVASCPRYADALLAIGLGEESEPFLGDYERGLVVHRDFRFVAQR